MYKRQFYTTWKGTGEITLEAGEDFDQVVLGISIGSFPYICEELGQTNSKWADMVANIETVQTQAAQFWLKPSFSDLGVPGEGVVVACFTATQLDTWADMSDLLPDEGWPESEVKSLGYFTGPMVGPSQAPPSDQTDFPAEMEKQRDQVIDQLIADRLTQLWPNYTGKAEIVSQYRRCNIDPSERYVLSAVGTSKYRLKSGESGFSNLILAGDWTDTRLNMGAVEGATVSGMQASKAICGYPEHIVLPSETLL